MKKKQVVTCWMGKHDVYGEALYKDKKGSWQLNLTSEEKEYAPIKITITAEWEVPE